MLIFSGGIYIQLPNVAVQLTYFTISHIISLNKTQGPDRNRTQLKKKKKKFC